MAISHYKNIQPLWEGIFLLSIKMIYFILLLNYFNIFISPLIFALTIYIYHTIIYYIYGLKALSGFDKVFLTTSPVGRYQITSLSRYNKNLDVEKFGKFLKERIVIPFSRYHSRLVKKNMEYFWYEDPDLEKACNSIVKLSPRRKNFEDALEFVAQEINNHIDIFNEYPYELNMVPFGEDSGICLFKYDHLLVDGLGIIASLCLAGDNFSENTYPKIIKMMKEPNIFQTLYLYLSAPLFGFITLIQFALYGDRKCPFKANKKPLSEDTIFVLSKNYKLKDFEKYRKENKVSFNDIMLCSFSVAMKNTLKKYDEYKNYKNLIIDLPVGRKKPENTIEKMNKNINNEASGIIVNMPLVDSVDDINIIKKSIRKNMRPEKIFAVGMTADILGNIFSWHIISYFAKLFTKRFDYMFTNVPGPAEKLYYYGIEVSDMYVFPSAGGGLPYVAILSYNDQFKIALNSNKNADCDIKELLYEYEKALEKFII
jgi:NRPS condensation-like uncharacterized protein